MRCKVPPLYWLLVAVPVAAVLHFLHASEVAVFAVSCLAIIPLAGLMGRATENLAESLGPGLGGLLNATFGNAAELIIALLALSNGQRALVKASITGSVVGNLLLVLGLACLCGGLGHRRQTFNRTAASLGATMLVLASVGLIFPTVLFYLLRTTTQAHAPAPQEVETLSDEISVLLAIMYILSLVFAHGTHQHLFAGPEAETEKRGEVEWRPWVSMLVLVIATIGVAGMSELLVGSIEAAARAMGMTELFIGVIVVAIVGNAAEHSTAVMVAMKDKMDLALTIAIGSGIQVALFVAPALVLAGHLMGQPIDLHFSPLEVVAVIIAVLVVALVSVDGETHWMEGALLLAVYIIIALAFYHYPADSAPVHVGG
jgi:Ca2+:H+ antiporter